MKLEPCTSSRPSRSARSPGASASAAHSTICATGAGCCGSGLKRWLGSHAAAAAITTHAAFTGPSVALLADRDVANAFAVGLVRLVVLDVALALVGEDHVVPSSSGKIPALAIVAQL